MASSTIFNRADYSYGLYIYAFPVQQTLIYIFPQWPLWLSIGACLVITVLLAALSWHLLEKPLLGFKPQRAKAKEAEVVDHYQEGKCVSLAQDIN